MAEKRSLLSRWWNKLFGSSRESEEIAAEDASQCVCRAQDRKYYVMQFRNGRWEEAPGYPEFQSMQDCVSTTGFPPSAG